MAGFDHDKQWIGQFAATRGNRECETLSLCGFSLSSVFHFFSNKQKTTDHR